MPIEETQTDGGEPVFFTGAVVPHKKDGFLTTAMLSKQVQARRALAETEGVKARKEISKKGQKPIGANSRVAKSLRPDKGDGPQDVSPD